MASQNAKDVTATPLDRLTSCVIPRTVSARAERSTMDVPAIVAAMDTTTSQLAVIVVAVRSVLRKRSVTRPMESASAERTLVASAAKGAP
eukprot:XP_783452.3 PREDICTED: uncharacterized protein LOC578170 [Strongylocentrotus purpuratus]